MTLIEHKKLKKISVCVKVHKMQIETFFQQFQSGIKSIMRESKWQSCNPKEIGGCKRLELGKRAIFPRKKTSSD